MSLTRSEKDNEACDLAKHFLDAYPNCQVLISLEAHSEGANGEVFFGPGSTPIDIVSDVPSSAWLTAQVHMSS